MNAFTTALDTIYGDDNYAVDAVYTPQGGSGQGVRAILKSPEEADPLFQTGAIVGKRVAKIRTSELAACKENDALAIGSDNYTIKAPQRADSRRLEWTMDLIEA